MNHNIKLRGQVEPLTLFNEKQLWNLTIGENRGMC